LIIAKIGYNEFKHNMLTFALNYNKYEKNGIKFIEGRRNSKITVKFYDLNEKTNLELIIT
jgi:hypothetical protein